MNKEKEIEEVKKNILARIGAMDGADLEKVLGFLDNLTKQKEREQGGD